MSIILRILSIQQEEYPRSQRAFELSIGKTSGYLNMIKKRNSVPGVDVINKIIEVYPKYSLQWLMTGKGEKYNVIHLNSVEEPKVIYQKNNEDMLLDVLKENRILNNENRALKQTIERLKKDTDNFDSESKLKRK